jgi:hypothetical protein
MLDRLDAGGSIRERLSDTLGMTRSQLLFGALAAAGAATIRPATAEAATLTQNDLRILNFDLQMEYLQAGMYSEALKLGALRPKIRKIAEVVGAHEWAHASALYGLVGDKAVSKGFYNYRGVTSNETSFLKTAVAFEDLTTALLKWQAVRLDSASVLMAAAALHTVEARHSAWMRRAYGITPVLEAFDPAAPQSEMRDLILSTNFIARHPRTGSRFAPGFAG